jgi:protein-L-isoaspartate(D-aspartate) O-methyltransferase
MVLSKQEMLDSVKDYISKFGFGDYEKRILKAMDKVDRIYFVPERFEKYAYDDNAMSIGHSQTISQPSTVARMLQLLELQKGDKVLEIGTGSGWNVCLIAWLVGENGNVLSLEIVPALAEKSRANIEKYKLDMKNVDVRVFDFRKLNKQQKFDKIIITAGVSRQQEESVCDFVFDLLNEKGILICPHRFGKLVIIKKNKGILREYTNEEYSFVPLILN